MAIDQQLLEILVCPKCKGDIHLTAKQDGLVCDACKLVYEIREDMQNLARKNLERLGLASRVDLKLRDIRLGFDETDADAGFLDVPNPWDYIRQIRSALKPGAPLGAIVPTTNQVQDLLPALRRNGFAFVEVCEILLRYYKPEPARLRPVDRMVAHTGFLIFGRRVEPASDERGLDLVRELGLEESAKS